MSVTARCSDCGKLYKFGDDRAGTIVPCKECGGTIDVPEIGVSKPKPKPKPAEKAPALKPIPRKVEVLDDDEDGEPIQLAKQANRESSKPRKMPAEEEGDGSPMGILIGIGVVAVILLVACGGGLVWYFNNAGKQDDPIVNNQNPNPDSFNNQGMQFPNQQNNNQGGNQNQGANPIQNQQFAPPPPVPIVGIPGMTIPVNPNPPIPPRLNAPIGVGNNAPNPLPQDDSLVIPRPFPGWKYQPDPVKELPKLMPGAWQLPVRDTFGDEVVLSPSTISSFVAVGDNSGDRSERSIWNFSEHKETGRIRGRLPIRDPISLSVDGKYLAGRSQDNRSIEVYETATGNRSLAITTPQNADVRRIDFGPENQVLAFLPNEKQILGYNIADGQQAYQINLGDRPYGDGAFAVSPGRNQVVVVTAVGIEFYDLKTGQPISKLDAPRPGFGSLEAEGIAFSNNGKQLAGMFKWHVHEGLLVWDLEKGELTNRFQFKLDFFLRRQAPAVFHWIADDSAFWIQENFIVSRENGQVLWTVPRDEQNYRKSKGIVAGAGYVHIEGNFQNINARLAELPTDQFAKAATVVKAGGLAIDAALPPLTQVQWEQAKFLPATNAPDSAKLEVEPMVAPGKPLGIQPTPITGAGQMVRQILFSDPAIGQAVVFQDLAPPGPGAKFRDNGLNIWLERIDLATGQLLGKLDFPFDTEVIAVSPDGTLVLTRIAEHQDRLDIYNLETKQHVCAWRPSIPQENRPDVHKITWARFLDSNTVLTMNQEGWLISWKIPTCEIQYAQGVGGNGFPVLSPGGKFLLSSNGVTVRFVETATGRTAAQVRIPSLSVMSGAGFRKDGGAVGIVSNTPFDTSVIKIDLKTGTVSPPLPIPTRLAGNVIWTGENQILVDGKTIVDFEKKGVVWHYEVQNGKSATESLDGKLWYIASSGGQLPGTLNVVELLDNKVQLAINRGGQLPAPLLGPGSSISVEYNLVAGQENFQSASQTGLAQKLQGLGFRIAEGQEYRMVAEATSRGTGENIPVRIFGIGGGETNVAVTEISCKVTLFGPGNQIILEENGSYKSYFGFIEHLGQGETPQSYADKRLWKSAPGFFSGFGMPANIFPPGAGDGFGKTVLGPQGPVN